MSPIWLLLMCSVWLSTESVRCIRRGDPWSGLRLAVVAFLVATVALALVLARLLRHP